MLIFERAQKSASFYLYHRFFEPYVIDNEYVIKLSIDTGHFIVHIFSENKYSCRKNELSAFLKDQNGDNGFNGENKESMRSLKNNNDGLLLANEVSKYLRLPLSTLYRLTKKRILKGIKVGKQWRYSRKDIEKYLSGLKNPIYYDCQTDFDSTERRAFPRLNCNILCSYRVLIPAIKDIHSNGSIRNISGNGILLSTSGDILSKINIGDPVELKFTLDLQNNNIKTDARIVRKTIDGFAMKFRNMSRKHRDSIVRFVG